MSLELFIAEIEAWGFLIIRIDESPYGGFSVLADRRDGRRYRLAP